MRYLCGLLLTAGLLSGICLADEVVTVDGSKYSGVVAAHDGQVVVRAADGNQTTLVWGQLRSMTRDVVATGRQHGLLGEYYSDQDFKQLSRVRVDPVIDCFWPGQPDAMVATDFCARWTGTIKARFSETYTIECERDDDVNLWIDGKQIIKGWMTGNRSITGKIELQAGNEVPIRLEFRDRMGDAVIRMFWSSPSQNREIVPTIRLTPAAMSSPAVAETPEQARMPKGVRGAFAYDVDWNSPRPIVRQYSQVDFDWGYGRADLLCNPAFASDFTFSIRPRYSGTYRFDLGGQADAGLIINGKQVFTPPECRGVIELKAGELYAAQLSYRKYADQRGKPQLFWAAIYQEREVVPQECLYLPDGRDKKADRELGNVRAEYFADLEWKRPVMVRREANIALQCNGPSPFSLLPEAYSARWTGVLKVAKTDTYTIHAWHDDVMFVWIDDKKVLDQNYFGEGEFKITLEAGHAYRIRADMNNIGGGPSKALLAWSTATMVRQVIPAEAFVASGEGMAFCDLHVTQPAPGMVYDTQRAFVVKVGIGENHGVAKLEYLANEEVIGTVPASQLEYRWSTPRTGVVKFGARALDAQGRVVGLAEPVAAMLLDRAQLPSPWCVLTTGPDKALATSKGGTFELGISGAELFDRQDACSLLLRKVEGDFDFSARLAGISGTDAASFHAAGLTVREGPEPYARHMAIVAGEGGAGGRVQVLLRSEREAQTQAYGVEDRAMTWMRLVRRGAKINVMLSANGKAWKLIRSENMDLPKGVYVGMLGASQQTGGKVAARFTDVTEDPQIPLEQMLTAGVVLRDGSFLAGEVLAMQTAGVELQFRDGRSMVLPLRQVARLLLKTVPAMVPSDADGKTGLFLSNGDFAEGVLRSLNPWEVRVNSLAMGLMTLSRNEIDQALLAPATQAAAASRISLTDGSVLYVKTVEPHNGTLRISTVCGVVIEPPMESVAEVQNVAATASR